jgi:hypothetical protein
MAVKTCHCTRHARYCSATDPPRGITRRLSYPEIPRARPYPFPVDPPRPGLDQPPVNKGARPARHRTRSLFTIPSFTSPWCPEMAGHSRSTSLQQLPQRPDKTSLLRHHPGASGFSWPYKREGGGLYERGKKDKDKSSPHHWRSTSQAIFFVLSRALSLRLGIGSLSHSL